MTWKQYLGGLLAVVLAAGVMIGCGEKEAERAREGMPFFRVKLRNTSPPEGPPATASVQGTSSGQPSESHTAGPAAPQQEVVSGQKGTQQADGVEITVNVGVTLTGGATYAGASIESVDIEANPGGGTATVNFHMGRPSEEIPLVP